MAQTQKITKTQIKKLFGDLFPKDKEFEGVIYKTENGGIIVSPAKIVVDGEPVDGVEKEEAYIELYKTIVVHNVYKLDKYKDLIEVIPSDDAFIGEVTVRFPVLGCTRVNIENYFAVEKNREVKEEVVLPGIFSDEIKEVYENMSRKDYVSALVNTCDEIMKEVCNEVKEKYKNGEYEIVVVTKTKKHTDDESNSADSEIEL